MCAAQSSWWVQLGFAAFDAGSDNLPRPGQVLRQYRTQTLKGDGKPWTQRDLAIVLEKQELAVRDMELRDAGLRDVIRLRQLAQLFDIPLLLFGLAMVPEPGTAENGWWIQQGFSAFDAGSDGFPRPEQVVRQYRTKKCKADGKPWTQRDLAQVLGKQELAIRDMELRGTGLNDISRRRFLAHLFDIPPILLGLAAVPQQSMTRGQLPLRAPTMLLTLEHIDLAVMTEVRDKLTWFWTQQTGTPQEILRLLEITLRRFYERFPIAKSSERLEIITVLCELHIHAANIFRDKGNSSKTLEHFNQTADLNTLLQESELQVDLLYRRGGLYLEKGKIALALDDYHSAEQELANVSPVLQAAVLLETGLSEARVASSHQQQSTALKKLDKAGYLIRGGQTDKGREKWPYLKVDLERYHLDRAATLIALGNYKEAQQEVNLLSPSHLTGRRRVYSVVLQSQSCFGLKEYAQAALLAEEALPLARLLSTHIQITRIQALYKKLKLTSFRNEPEIERLGYVISHP